MYTLFKKSSVVNVASAAAAGTHAQHKVLDWKSQ
jgi:hypothetical protein